MLRALQGQIHLFHIGHLRYLEFARQQGDYLIAATLADDVVERTKGKRPVIPLAQRLEILQGMRCVDEVRIQPCSTRDDPDSVIRWMLDWQVQQVVVGGMWQGDEQWQRLSSCLRQHGIEVMFAPATEAISTTDIMLRIRQSGTGKAAGD